MIKAIGLYGMGLGCLALGLVIAWLQAENYARADRLQALERENFDLEVVNRELDARLTVRLREIEQDTAGENTLEMDPSSEGLQ